VAALDGDDALAVLDVEPPLVAAAELDELGPVPLLLVDVADPVADFALAVDVADFSELLLTLTAEDDAAEAEVALVVAAVAEALPLGVIDSTVLELSTTNWGV